MAAANSSTATKAKNSGRNTTTARKSGSKGRKGASKNKAGKEKAHQRKVADVNEYKDRMAFEIAVTLIIMVILAIFLYLSYFGLGGVIGKVFGGIFLGVFGWSAWIVPAGAIFGYVFALANKGDRRVPRKLVSLISAIWLLLGISDLLFKQEIISEYYTSNHVLHKKYFECMDLTLGDVLSNGKGSAGILGRVAGSIFSKVTGETGAVIIMLALFLLCMFIFYGMELMAALRKRNAYKQKMENIYEEVSRKEDYQEPSYHVTMPQMPKGQRPHSTVMQSVNLKEMNQTLDEIEENARQRALDRSAMEEILADDKTGKAVIKKTHKKDAMDKPSSRAISNGRDIVSKVPGNGNMLKLDYGSNINDSYNTPDIPVQNADKEESDEERRRRNIENIPIFRDELNKKFGKKNKAKEEGQVPLFPYKEKEDQPPVITREEADSNITSNTDNTSTMGLYGTYGNISGTGSLTGTDYDAGSISSLNHTGNADNVSYADNSGGMEEDYTIDNIDEIISIHNNKVMEAEEKNKNNGYSDEGNMESYSGRSSTDIYPGVNNADNPVNKSVYETEEEGSITSRDAAPDITSDILSYKRPEKTVDHGRIGGEDYISASDTFNALNDSKMGTVQEEKREYVFPPIGLLHIPEGSSNGMTDEELRNTALKLQDTLKSFNVNVSMGAVTCGPTVTRYELFPEQGVRVNKITNLADDLKLSLAAPSIRIEAPIPGKPAVGIEVPNPEPGSVAFRELLEEEAFKNAKSPVTFAVGKDIAGKPIMTDIAKMPHLLIAGATGSGKSVCINTLIMSILYKADPDDVKLIMIDPKVVELSVYNGIPHLFCPVVTDPKEASAALNWAVREMMDRYNKFKELGVRNIAGYNKKIKTVDNPLNAGYAKMPSLVIIVDEFADLMMVASKEVEEAVCRLAQLARAAGIHLVLATQRPSVNVITGVIKANIPSRIAFSVSSAVDSRTIIDKTGAEKLVGKGDMLFFPQGYPEPVRVQGAFVSDKEVGDVVNFLRENNDMPDYNENVTEITEIETAAEPPAKENKSDRDEYFEEAGRFVIKSERAAAGQLQRRFSIGFNRAGRILDQLHKAGVVGPAEGTKPRKVLMTMDDFDLLLGNAAPVPGSEIEETMQGYAEINGIHDGF